MICPSCGYDPGAAATCPRCGATLAAPAAEGSLRPAGPEASPWAPPEDPSAEPTVALPGHEPTLSVIRAGGTPTPGTIVSCLGLPAAGAAPGRSRMMGPGCPQWIRRPRNRPEATARPVLLVAARARLDAWRRRVFSGWFGGGKRPADVLPRRRWRTAADLDPPGPEGSGVAVPRPSEVKDAMLRASGSSGSLGTPNMDEQLRRATTRRRCEALARRPVRRRGAEARRGGSGSARSGERRGQRCGELRASGSPSKQDYDDLRGFRAAAMTRTPATCSRNSPGTLRRISSSRRFRHPRRPRAGGRSRLRLASIAGGDPSPPCAGARSFRVGRVRCGSTGSSSGWIERPGGRREISQRAAVDGAAISIWGGAAVAQSGPGWVRGRSGKEYGLSGRTRPHCGKADLSVPTSALRVPTPNRSRWAWVISDDVAVPGGLNRG